MTLYEMQLTVTITIYILIGVGVAIGSYQSISPKSIKENGLFAAIIGSYLTGLFWISFIVSLITIKLIHKR